MWASFSCKTAVVIVNLVETTALPKVIIMVKIGSYSYILNLTFWWFWIVVQLRYNFPFRNNCLRCISPFQIYLRVQTLIIIWSLFFEKNLYFWPISYFHRLSLHDQRIFEIYSFTSKTGIFMIIQNRNRRLVMYIRTVWDLWSFIH